jgi:hypothetical protein
MTAMTKAVFGVFDRHAECREGGRGRHAESDGTGTPKVKRITTPMVLLLLIGRMYSNLLGVQLDN